MKGSGSSRQIYEAAGYSVYFTSANDKESVSMVRELLKGKTQPWRDRREWGNPPD